MSIKVEDYYSRETFQKMKAFADKQETPFVVIDTSIISQAYDDLRAGFEFALQTLGALFHPQVIKLDALALGALLAVPVRHFKPVLGARALSAE